MEQISFTELLPESGRHTRQIGGSVYIFDDDGRVLGREGALQLALEWFRVPNEVFYARHGFNWIPAEPYYSQARKMLHSGVMLNA